VRLIVPLVALLCVAAAISYLIAVHFANMAYDRWLLDSARSLAQEVKSNLGKVSFEVPPMALEIFKWDELDKTYFKIETRRAGSLAGDKDIPAPPDQDAVRKQPQFYNARMHGDLVRVVALVVNPSGVTDEVLVQVAETVAKRQTLANDILIMVIVPQALLIAVASVLLWLGVNRGLRPLKRLAEEIATRTHHDLSPISDQHIPIEVRTLTDTINDLLRRLGAVLSAQRRFVADAAHQLRTPLTALKVQTARALRAYDMESLHPALIQLQTSADRAAHLSNQLLLLARAEPDFNASQAFVPIDLCTLVRETCMEWVPKALERDIDLGVVTTDEPVMINGDATMLRELLNNLLDNAIRYGRVHGNITVTVRMIPMPQLIVDDDSPGIPESQFKWVFERFYRVPGSPGDGCGLGLAIVKEFAHAHGANVFIRRPDSGIGTQIMVEFGSTTLRERQMFTHCGGAYTRA
jgi:two-component system sensor histidine kinase TctE